MAFLLYLQVRYGYKWTGHSPWHHLLNKDSLKAHPDIIIDKKSHSPEKDKYIHDARLLIPVLKNFFRKHPLFNPRTFLGDSAFDTISIYKDLFGDTFGKDRHFSKAYIPMNRRSGLEGADYAINGNGIPCCPHDPSLPMKPEGNTSHLRSGIPSFKFVCPKIKWKTGEGGKCRRTCFCDNPCTTSKSGLMVYVYSEKNLRAYQGVLRGTEE